MSPILNDIWTPTATGRQWFFLNPDPAHVSLEDIAIGLSRASRFSGQTRPDLKAYSVAQHSLMVARHVPEEARLAALIHDAHEAYLGDLITPLKRAIAIKSPDARRAYDEIEELSAKAIHKAFGVRWPLEPEIAIAVKAADIGAVLTEKNDLMIPGPVDWGVEGEPLIDICLPILHEHRARQQYIAAVNAALELRGLK